MSEVAQHAEQEAECSYRTARAPQAVPSSCRSAGAQRGAKGDSWLEPSEEKRTLGEDREACHAMQSWSGM